MLERVSTYARIVLALAATGTCLAQQYSFRHYGAAEGLQNLTILSLAQDGQGFLWAGSEGGLYRYDGTRFHLMSAAEGLPCTSEIHALHVSADGALWANTCSKLFRFDGRQFRVAAGINEMFNRSQAMADGAGDSLIVAAGSGLRELTADGADRAFAATGKATRGIFRYGTQLWFGCARKLCVEQSGRLLEYGEDAGLPADSWDAVAVTPDGTVWTRSPGKLYRKAPASTRFVKESAEIAPSMYWGSLAAARDGDLLVPTDKGLAIHRGERWSLVDETRGLRSSMVSAVLQDREGSLWIGLVGGGLARWLGYGEWEGWTRSQGLASNIVWNILRDRKGSLWVATSMELTRLEGPAPRRTWTRQDGLGGENVRWLGETPDGAVWLITKPGGLARIDPDERIRAIGRNDGLDPEEVRTAGLVDREGRLWVATATGVFRNQSPGSSAHFVRINPPGVLEKGAWSLAEDTQGTIWVSAVDGLWRLSQGQWRHYQQADGLLSDRPYIIALAADNSLWLRHRFDAGVERVEFAGDRLLRSTAIVKAAGDSTDVTSFHGFDAAGRFWRGTGKGAWVLTNGLWTQYSREDGLIWDDCDGEAFWADADGSVWLGTSGGLAHFRPRPEKETEAAAAPIVSSLEIRKQPRLVRASFSSLNYLYEQLARFGYRLDDGPWTETPERSVAIAGVSPGRHRLEVRSQIRTGPFSANTAVAEFYVDPLWWESWWFRGLGILMAAGLIFGAVLWRHRALRYRNEVLELAVRERTAELEAERAKVMEEKQRADEASQAKGQFLANMSHEIRTPLNGLIGLASLLETMQDPAEARETIRLMRSSGQMLLGVINDVLDFSKVEAGKLELDNVRFDLRTALEQAAGLFRGTAAAKNLRLELVLESALPTWVNGDEIRLRQVVQNLISNGLKFTSAGGIAISAGVEAAPETGYLIRIEVRDTGIGIAPDRIGHLFSSFSQADSSISRRYGGTGLGLAISKRLVELMGGAIDVHSEVGVGTAVAFTVQLGRATAPVAVEESAMPDVSRLKVLLAEDNQVNQIVGRKLLQKLGIAADVVKNGAEAIEAALLNAYDLILMDVQMPDVDGIAATREIRARIAGERQPFICGLSAHATSDFQEQCHAAGMDAYLTKPLDFEKLKKLLVEQSARAIMK